MNIAVVRMMLKCIEDGAVPILMFNRARMLTLAGDDCLAERYSGVSRRHSIMHDKSESAFLNIVADCKRNLLVVCNAT